MYRVGTRLIVFLKRAQKTREMSAFRFLDDGYKKSLTTMDKNPLRNLENGYCFLGGV